MTLVTTTISTILCYFYYYYYYLLLRRSPHPLELVFAACAVSAGVPTLPSGGGVQRWSDLDKAVDLLTVVAVFD